VRWSSPIPQTFWNTINETKVQTCNTQELLQRIPVGILRYFQFTKDNEKISSFWWACGEECFFQVRKRRVRGDNCGYLLWEMTSCAKEWRDYTTDSIRWHELKSM
jgi:hypothetical protein